MIAKARLSATVAMLLAVSCASALAQSALAQSPALTSVSVTCTATTDCASAFAAIAEGIFRRHGLDVSFVSIGLNSNIPGALMSNSVQFGGTTLPVFMQAVDGGLDLVAVAGASVTAPETVIGTAVVARTGAKIAGAKELEGRKVGVPGIGAFLDVLFRQWLLQNGADPRKVTFVEVTFPTMTDVLKAGTVDAVVTGEPFMSRTLAAGAGFVVANFLRDIPENEAIILYASTRPWTDAHPDTTRAFRAAIVEGASFVRDNPARARDHIAKYTKLPPEVVRSLVISRSSATLDKAQLDWWVEVMRRQDMLQTAIPTATLIAR